MLLPALHPVPWSLALKSLAAVHSLHRLYSTSTSTSSGAPDRRVLDVNCMPPMIILLRHGESAGLEEMQEDLQVPNHRVPLSASGVRQAAQAGQIVQQLLQDMDEQQQQQQQQPEAAAAAAAINRLFLFTSPFLRCIQTAQHAVRAIDDERVTGVREEVQLREQDWGNHQEPGQQAKNYVERLKYGRFFFRFPEGESAADVYDRMTMFQDHFVRDIACQSFGGSTSVMLVTHGLALRLFLMRWLHWSVDEFLQVHNPPTAVPIVLSRTCPSLGCSPGGGGGPAAAVSLENIKACYQLQPSSLPHLRGVSADMISSRLISSKQQLLEWRPYQRQVPPPPALDPAKEAALQQLMEIGYRGHEPC